MTSVLKLRVLASLLTLRVRRTARLQVSFHGCMVWIEKSDTRVTDRHHVLAEGLYV